MTVLSSNADVRTLDDALALAGATGAAFQTYLDRALAEPSVPPGVLLLCRVRLAQVMGRDATARVWAVGTGAANLPIDQFDALPDWYRHDVFTDVDRACLYWTEQFALDPKELTDEDCTAVRDHLGEAGLVAFTLAISVSEALLRMTALLGIDVDEL